MFVQAKMHKIKLLYNNRNLVFYTWFQHLKFITLEATDLGFTNMLMVTGHCDITRWLVSPHDEALSEEFSLLSVTKKFGDKKSLTRF